MRFSIGEFFLAAFQRSPLARRDRSESTGTPEIPVQGWIGVDLDGTLAYYDSAAGIDHIGSPVPAMANRVRAWLAEGREVRIFTARASIPELIEPVRAWCAHHFGVRLNVTNAKDFGMIELWDDRCVQIEFNTGQRIVNPS